MPQTGKRYVVDTSAVIAFRRGHRHAYEAFERAEVLYKPSIVRGELYFGCHFAENSARCSAELEELLPAFVSVDVTDGVAAIYGRMKSQLRKVGTPIPENDIWIASTAAHSELPLLAQDAHFSRITELRCLQL